MSSQFLSNKKRATDQKLRGGYYTPDILAEYLANWAIRTGSERILEPSCGDGSFVRAAANRLDYLAKNADTATGNLTCVELQHSELTKAAASLAEHSHLAAKFEWISADWILKKWIASCVLENMKTRWSTWIRRS